MTLGDCLRAVLVIENLDFLLQAVHVPADFERDLLCDLVRIEVECIEDFDARVVGVDTDFLDALNLNDGSCQREGLGRILRGGFHARPLHGLRVMPRAAFDGVADTSDRVDLVCRVPFPNFCVREDLADDTLVDSGHQKLLFEFIRGLNLLLVQ